MEVEDVTGVSIGQELELCTKTLQVNDFILISKHVILLISCR